MNKISTLTFTILITSASLMAQTQLPNTGFENLGNASPGKSTELTGWYSNKSGSSIAQAGGQTCFQDNTIHHSGSNSMRLQTISYLGTAVNGSATTGVINAPSFTKSEGYIGTINSTTASDDRRYACIDRPDSIVGWYQYTPGDATEQAKVRAILHTGDYNDPETPVNGNHPDLSANKIGDALFVSTAGATVSTWTRFAAAFTYTSSATPAYIMVNITSSYNQATTVTGSKFWLDDIALIYNPTAGINNLTKTEGINVFYSADKNVHVDFYNKTENQSTLSIFDLTGKMVVFQKIDNSKLNTVSVATLNEGLYLYLISGTGSQKAGKFIID
jgi:hypothetical protein